jgi:hypothetical protein
MGNDLCSTTRGFISVEDRVWPNGVMTKKYGFKPRFDESNCHKLKGGQLEYLLPEGHVLEAVDDDNYVIWTSSDKTEVAFKYRAISEYGQSRTELIVVEPDDRATVTEAYIKLLGKGGSDGDDASGQPTAEDAFVVACRYYSSTVGASRNMARLQSTVDLAYESMRTTWLAMSDAERALNPLPARAILTNDGFC